MATIKHKIKHYYQPTNYTCSQSALAMLLSHYDDFITPENIITNIPIIKDDKGEDWGTIIQQLATWCLKRGYKVELHTADFQILDLSWAKLNYPDLINQMETAKEKHTVPSLGTALSKIYMQSYIDFVSTGGNLFIHPFISTKLISSLLQASPLIACVCFNVLNNTGKSKDIGLRKSISDDIDGKISNHSVVIYGKDEFDNYLIADPWDEKAFYSVEPERLIASMTASQIECDNIILQITPSANT